MKLSSRFFSRLKTVGYILVFPFLFLCGLAMVVWILTPLAIRLFRRWFRRRVMRRTYDFEDPDSPHGRAITLARRLEDEGSFNPLTWLPGDPVPDAIAEYLTAPLSHSRPAWVQDAHRRWASDAVQPYGEMLAEGLHSVRLDCNRNTDGVTTYALAYFRLPEHDDLRACLSPDGYGLILPASDEESWAVAFEVGGHPINQVFWATLRRYEYVYDLRFALEPRYEDADSFYLIEYSSRRLAMKRNSLFSHGLETQSPEIRRLYNLFGGGEDR